MIKAVLFDLDGTLTDSDKVHFQVFQDIFAEHGIPLDKALYQQRISGRQNAAIMADFFPTLSVAEGEAFSIEKEATFRQQAKDLLTPVPGLMTLLERIEAKGLSAAVVTNAPTENAFFMLDTLNLRDRFDPIIIADDLPKGKPDPLPYQTALDQLEISPEEVIVFEDSSAGVRAAVAAGILTLGVMTTHSGEALTQLGAKRAIADFTDPYIQTLLD
ncbi:MAG: HAD-IA family hydrolase [Cyanobacteria bacterium J06621_3]